MAAHLLAAALLSDCEASDEKPLQEAMSHTATDGWLDDAGIMYDACSSESSKIREVLIGTRGSWWLPYAVLITDGDAVQENQVGGYRDTLFGARLKVIYGSWFRCFWAMSHSPVGQCCSRPWQNWSRVRTLCSVDRQKQVRTAMSHKGIRSS